MKLMKQIIGLYLFIGLCFAPLIYSNNAQSYRNISSGYAWGQSIGGSLFYWPSYLFSIEPELNGDSLDAFTKSIEEVIAYRNDKMFTGGRTNEHALLLFNAIGNCALSKGYISYNNNLHEKLFTQNIKYEQAQKKLMEIFDGDDFADILEQGSECLNDMKK